jgi:drug/metabolite transporter (DMT)-like permease
MPESTQHPARELSLPQVVAGAVAAATATILSSRLDLMGTVLGAVLASIVSAIVAASVAGWWHRMREARDWVPQRIKGTLVGVGALALMVVAFHTGVDLLTADLPRDTFAARWLSEVGLG